MTMFCDCGNPEAHRGEHIPKPMTDTPLDLDAILAAHASASPYGRTEVAGRFHASYYADDADVALVFASVPALVAALRKAETAHAALIADLRALRPVQHVCSDGVWLRYADVRDLADRHHASECIWLSDLRERIAQRIDQAWAEANDQRPRSEYRDGYLDGLEHAEAAARSTPLTMDGAS